MRALLPKALSVPWTCRQCLPQRSPHFRQFASAPAAGPKRPYRRRYLIIAATGGSIAAAGTFFMLDDVKHAFAAAQRTGRVVSTLFVCINEYEIYRVALNHKTDDPEERDAILRKCHSRCAERTLRAMEKNGSIFIKLGQHLSSMGYLLPTEWCTPFVVLQDRCPVSSIESIEKMFYEETGRSISDLFTKFDALPIGAASLAQVHRATLKENGMKVAVKVQHPALSEWAPLDLALTSFTFATLKRFFPDYDLEWLSNEMQFSLPQELDFNLEAENTRRVREHFSHIRKTPLVVPDVMWSRKRILVMEYVSGHRLDDLEYLDKNGISRDEVSASLARVFNEMIFGDNAPLHCDPHGGNLAIRKNDNRRSPNFDIILYDHGLYRDIPLDYRRSYAKLWLAVLDADETRMRKYAKEVGGITDEQFPVFASAITGRDYSVVTKSVATRRSEEEKATISDALGEGLLQQIVQMLGTVPRIMLLILKTNDLTRSLDENLQTRQGPERTFLILARYCSKTVFNEQLEKIRKAGSSFSPKNVYKFFVAWLGFARVELKLSLFETYLTLKSQFVSAH